MPAGEQKNKRAKFDINLDRHEGKYIIPRRMVSQIRDYIEPFCEPDPHCSGDPPEYVVTTLQLDSPSLALHKAKENDALSRFKLRVRTYGEPGQAPVFMEVKRKVRGTIMKSRTALPPDVWCQDLVMNPKVDLNFKSRKEEDGFLEFVRLTREIGARPVMLIRYTRESYFGKIDHYARVTFDRKLEYQPTESWTDWGKGGTWWSMDTPLAQNKQFPFSGVVLELKALSDAPLWMIDLVMEFGLERTGNCKYSTAILQEAMFRGTPSLPGYAVEVLSPH